MVVWQSQKNELSPYDIRSVDAGGMVFYIEVKSTAGSDEGAEFELSSGELEWALTHPENYSIYRVVDANSVCPRIFIYDDIVGRITRGYIHIAPGSAKVRLPRSTSTVEPIEESISTAGGDPILPDTPPASEDGG